MTQEQHHEELIKGVTAQLKPILDKSPQAMYVYLDDEHKACNKKFADLLGYESAKAWADAEAPLADIIEKDQERVIAAYENASEKLQAGSLDVSFTNVKTGKIIPANLIITPYAYSGHIFALHFISKKAG